MNKNFSLKNLTVVWMLAFVIASIFLSFTHFKSESNDSKYYSELVVRYQDADFSNLITPKWGTNYWSFDPNSYMRDQFPGQLLMGVALTRLGVGAEHALHILGMFFQIASFLILASIAQKMRNQSQGTAFLVLALLLSPLAFSYNVRANHELGIMFFSFLALFAGINLRQSKIWGLVAIVCSVSLLLIKGPFFIFSFALFSIGYFYSKERNHHKFLFLSVLFLCLGAVVLTTLGFEALFSKISGESFLSEFWRIQIEQRAMIDNKEHFFIIRKLLNFYYYFSHYLAYSLPWSLILIYYVAIKGKFREFVLFCKSPLSQLFFFAAIVYCLVFSMSNRVAGRYTFPGYFLFTAWSALALYQLSAFLQEKMAALKNKATLLLPLIWLVSFFLHFLRTF